MHTALTESFAPRLVSLPKPGGERGRRLFTILDHEDAERYRLLVARVAGAVERALGPGVHSDRITDTASLTLEPWQRARRSFRRHITQAMSRRGSDRTALARADVRNCFPSIQPAVVEGALRDLGARRKDVAAIRGLLERLAEQGVPGLPVGPEPSAVLANAVLIASDAALQSGGADVFRWVDDYLIVTADAAIARAALERLRDTLAETGMKLAEQKTELRVARRPMPFAFSLSGPAAFGLESGG